MNPVRPKSVNGGPFTRTSVSLLMRGLDRRPWLREAAPVDDGTLRGGRRGPASGRSIREGVAGESEVRRSGVGLSRCRTWYRAGAARDRTDQGALLLHASTDSDAEAVDHRTGPCALPSSLASFPRAISSQLLYYPGLASPVVGKAVRWPIKSVPSGSDTCSPVPCEDSR